MSTDSTELTFVRCPSCRSLVPAVSPRCRMCGATLDASKASDEGDKEPRKSGRVRQRTVSISEEELAAATEDNQNITPIVEETVPEAISENPPVDPLGAFIEEVPTDDKSSNGNGNSAHPEDLVHQLDDEPVAEVTFEPAVEEAPRSKVIVESGRRPGQRSGLSFGRTRPEQEAKPESKPINGKPAGFEAHKRSISASAPEEESETLEAPALEKAAPAPVNKTVAKPVHTTVENQKGRLFGWLVSYADARGSAVELREGKFFVSNSSLKQNDLILEDESVSTPHALIGISANDGFIVQDLMSDRGVFIRKRTSEAYQRIMESAKLEHGDWIRFGDVEFLVAIIAGPNGR